jgi:hypothetical protein
VTLHSCHNIKRKDRYQVHVREYSTDGSWLLRRHWINDVMSKDCRYDRKESDKSCNGCRK